MERTAEFFSPVEVIGGVKGRRRWPDEPTPTDADPTGEWYCFERGARKDTGGDGWADVWKRGCLAWEYKGRCADLDAGFNQLRQYVVVRRRRMTPRNGSKSTGCRADRRGIWVPSNILTELSTEELALAQDPHQRERDLWRTLTAKLPASGN